MSARLPVAPPATACARSGTGRGAPSAPRRGVAKRRRDAEPARVPGRSEVVLRIALDRVMDQFPPGTFLAPEDEVAASLGDPGFLRISGELVVTQLSEGVARVAWSDIADQFPAHLVGLSKAEITEHLDEGLRLPIDEVIRQLPQELFVADTPEVEIHGLHRIPVPFHPMDESEAPTEAAAVRQPEPEITPAPAVRPTPPPEAPRVPAPIPLAVPSASQPAEPAEPVAIRPLAAPRPIEPAMPVTPEPVRKPEPAALELSAAAAPGTDEPIVRISWSRVAAGASRGSVPRPRSTRWPSGCGSPARC